MVPCELLVVGDRSDLGNPGEDRVAPGGRRRAEPVEAVADESTEELAEPAVRLERPLQSAAPLAGDEPVMAVDAASRGRGAIEIERVRDDESNEIADGVTGRLGGFPVDDREAVAVDEEVPEQEVAVDGGPRDQLLAQPAEDAVEPRQVAENRGILGEPRAEARRYIAAEIDRAVPVGGRVLQCAEPSGRHREIACDAVARRGVSSPEIDARHGRPHERGRHERGAPAVFEHLDDLRERHRDRHVAGQCGEHGSLGLDGAFRAGGRRNLDRVDSTLRRRRDQQDGHLRVRVFRRAEDDGLEPGVDDECVERTPRRRVHGGGQFRGVAKDRRHHRLPTTTRPDPSAATSRRGRRLRTTESIAARTPARMPLPGGVGIASTKTSKAAGRSSTRYAGASAFGSAMYSRSISMPAGTAPRRGRGGAEGGGPRPRNGGGVWETAAAPGPHPLYVARGGAPVTTAPADPHAHGAG